MWSTYATVSVFVHIFPAVTFPSSTVWSYLNEKVCENIPKVSETIVSSQGRLHEKWVRIDNDDHLRWLIS